MTVTLTDWLELLELKPTFDDLLTGKERVSDVRAAVAEAMDRYPNVSQDYTAALAAASALVDAVQDTIDEQALAIADFNAAGGEFGLTFPHDPDRLLSAADLAALDALHQELADLAARHQRDMEDLQDEIERFQDEIERLQRDMGTGVEVAASDLEAAASELESAAADLAGFG